MVSERCLVAKAPALGAGNRRFESFRSDIYKLHQKIGKGNVFGNKQIAFFFVIHSHQHLKLVLPGL